MEWFKKHADTVVVLTGILSSMIWMNGKFEHLQNQINDVREQVVIMKTVLIMQKIMPTELATAVEAE